MTDLSYRSPKTEVRESSIHGKGLFAKEAVLAGEVVAVKGGHILTKQEWTTLEKALGPAEVQLSEQLFIAPVGEDQREGSMLYTNHSCDLNIGIQGQIQRKIETLPSNNSFNRTGFSAGAPNPAG